MTGKSTGKTILAILTAIGALVLIAMPSVAVEVVYPVERANRTFVTRVWTRITGFFKGSAVAAENVRLRREVESLKMIAVDNKRLEEENVRLRKALNYMQRARGSWLAAGVLSRGGGAAAVKDIIRVNKGTLDGVTTGAAVVVPEGLVGRVGAVTPHTCEVALITDHKVMVGCEIETTSGARARGILSGGGDMLTIRHLTGAEGIPLRSRVLTSGRGGVFPRGLEVGTFLGIREGSSGLISEGEVQPQVDFSTLEDVFIRRER